MCIRGHSHCINKQTGYILEFKNGVYITFVVFVSYNLAATYRFEYIVCRLQRLNFREAGWQIAPPMAPHCGSSTVQDLARTCEEGNKELSINQSMLLYDRNEYAWFVLMCLALEFVVTAEQYRWLLFPYANWLLNAPPTEFWGTFMILCTYLCMKALLMYKIHHIVRSSSLYFHLLCVYLLSW